MAESKLADFEKEKMMIELDVKETIARHKTEVTERMAWAAKVTNRPMYTSNILYIEYMYCICMGHKVVYPTNWYMV